MSEALQPVAWGKLARDANGVETGRLSLVAHSLDVAAVFGALLRLPTLRRRLEQCAGRELDPVDSARLTVLAFLHDIGKACVGFQSKSLTATAQAELLSRIGGTPKLCGHTNEFCALVENVDLSRRFFAHAGFRQVFDWDPSLSLWLAAVSSHSTPVQLDAKHYGQSPYWTWGRIKDYDPWQTLNELQCHALGHWPEAFGEVGAPLPDRPAFVHAYAGMAALADWIASNPNPACFPFEPTDLDQRWPVARARARAVLKAMRIDMESQRLQLRSRALSFEQVFVGSGNEPSMQANELQAQMSRLNLGPVVVAEAQTGSGKTEAALWRYKTLFEAGEVDSLCLALPTRVAATQMQARVTRFFERLFPDASDRPGVLMAAPGYFQDGEPESIERLAAFESLWADADAHSGAHAQWVAEDAKRALAGACVITTIDQLLLSTKQARHSQLRGLTLLRSLLVIDEVHASDMGTISALQSVLRRQREGGGHALLLSATLGVAARERLIHPQPAAMSAASALSAPYPAVSDRRGSVAASHIGRQKHVAIELRPLIDTSDAIATLAVDAVERGARVLILRNTVADVLAVQSALEMRLGLDHPALFHCMGVVSPYHGRYAPADRRLLDQAVEQRLGHSATDASPAVVCGTQTLEQCLDIDADLLITDLAPMDVLLQRMGRLHRQGQRRRPTDFDQPRVIVLTPVSRDLSPYLTPRRGSHGLGGHVYPNLPALEATWSQLESRDSIAIPNDSRVLVELTTDEQRLGRLTESKGDRWRRHWQRLVGRAQGQLPEPGYARLDWDTPWAELAPAVADPDVAASLAGGALRLPLASTWISPFGSRLSELSVPAWMGWDARAIASAAVYPRREVLIVEHDDRALHYSRMGLTLIERTLGRSSG